MFRLVSDFLLSFPQKASRFVRLLTFGVLSLEIGHAFGKSPCHCEPSLVALAEAVTSDAGGHSIRQSPWDWKQVRGAVANLQATLAMEKFRPHGSQCTKFPGNLYLVTCSNIMKPKLVRTIS